MGQKCCQEANIEPACEGQFQCIQNEACEAETSADIKIDVKCEGGKYFFNLGFPFRLFCNILYFVGAAQICCKKSVIKTGVITGKSSQCSELEGYKCTPQSFCLDTFHAETDPSIAENQKDYFCPNNDKGDFQICCKNPIEFTKEVSTDSCEENSGYKCSNVHKCDTTKAFLFKGEKNSEESPSYDYGTVPFKVRTEELLTEGPGLCDASYHICCVPIEDLDCKSNGFQCTSNSQCLDQDLGETSASKFTCPNNEEICCRNKKPTCSRRRGASCVNPDLCPSGVEILDNLSCPLDGQYMFFLQNFEYLTEITETISFYFHTGHVCCDTIVAQEKAKKKCKLRRGSSCVEPDQCSIQVPKDLDFSCQVEGWYLYGS